MRKAFAIFAAFAVLAGVAYAGKLKSITLSARSLGTGTNEATAATTIEGYLDTILLDVATATSTGNVTVTWQPSESTVGAVTLATVADMAADTTVRTRVDGTGTDGTALSSDPPGRIAIPGNGAVTLSVTNASASNVTFNAIIIYEGNE